MENKENIPSVDPFSPVSTPPAFPLLYAERKVCQWGYCEWRRWVDDNVAVALRQCLEIKIKLGRGSPYIQDEVK